MTTSSLGNLRSYLAAIPPGKINDALQADKIEALLIDCWGELTGDASALEIYKLQGRVEQLRWEPPCLSFAIERHGATVMGSVYAHLQDWTVDIDTGTASLTPEPGRRRQVGTKQRSVKVEPIANEVVELICAGKEDGRLRWYGKSRVRVQIGEIFPEGSAVKETLQGRRKRFRNALEKLLTVRGWQVAPSAAPNTYIRSEASKLSPEET